MKPHFLMEVVVALICVLAYLEGAELGGVAVVTTCFPREEEGEVLF